MDMQTQYLPTAIAWLESTAVDGGRPEERRLESFPFTIGRGSSCALQIDSHRVSREHATLERIDDQFRVLDLGSTNGTFVNGRRIHETELCDGDLVAFADSEFSFRRLTESIREAATQVFDSNSPVAENATDGWGIVREIRRLQEQLTQSAVEPCFEPVVELLSGNAFGFTAVQKDPPEISALVQQLLEQAECLPWAQLRKLHRAAAVEDACRLSGSIRLFLPISSFEVGLDDLPASLEQLCCVISPEQQLIAEFPATAACNIPYFCELLETIRGSGIAVAYDGFAGGPQQLKQLKDIPPDYIKLSGSHTRGLAGDPSRQRKLQTVVRAAAEIDCRIIAMDIRALDEAHACRDAGCHFAQGEFFRNAPTFRAVTDQQLAEAHAS